MPDLRHHVVVVVVTTGRGLGEQAGVLVGVEFDDGSSDVAETKLAEKLVQVEAANPGLHVDSMGRNDLIIALKAKGLKGNGTTSELAARLKAAL